MNNVKIEHLLKRDIDTVKKSLRTQKNFIFIIEEE
jgi:hypothetical protein